MASTTYTYFFDSLREDKKYIANINKCGQVMSVALEGEEAKDFILKNTGLHAKKKAGTRIIIESPKPELIEAIETGSIISFIQESWWLIIQKFDETSCISVNGVPVNVSNDIKDGKNVYELPSPELCQPNYRVKNFGVYVFEKGQNRWSGFSYYRKGMKIGEIDIKDIPEKIKGNFWGYIEVDEPWEDALAEIEDKVHFGVSKGKKQTTTYQLIKNYCDSKFKQLLAEWGYIKDKEHEDKRLHDELRQIAEDIQNLFDKLGFEDLGKGPKKSDFDVRWQDIVFPTPGTETVKTGDPIRFSMRIKSSYASDKKFQFKLFVRNPKTTAVISEIAQETVTVKPNIVFKKEFILKVSTHNSEQYAENRIVLVVKAVGSAKEKVKEIAYFYDTQKPDRNRNEVTLTLHECIFPQPGSRRVNFAQALKKVCYRIDNKRNITLNYRLNVSIHNASDVTCPKIADIAFLDGSVKPYEEEITEHLPVSLAERRRFWDEIKTFATKEERKRNEGAKATTRSFYEQCFVLSQYDLEVVQKLSWRQWQDILDRVTNREDQRIFEWIRRKSDKIREDDWREFEKGLHLFLKNRDTSVFSDAELFEIYNSLYAMAVYWRISFAQFSKDFPKSAKIKTKARRSKKYQETVFRLKKELRKPLDEDIFEMAFDQAMA